MPDYEFQRLHGMGDALYATLPRLDPDIACRIYAPVGGHRDLLAYLVRRLLENGANSSFVSVAADPNVSDRSAAAQRGRDRRRRRARARHPRFRGRPIFTGPPGVNSRGVEFGHRACARTAARRKSRGRPAPATAAPIVDGREWAGTGTRRRQARRSNAHRSDKSSTPMNQLSLGRWTAAAAALLSGARLRRPSARRGARSRRGICWKRAAAALSHCWWRRPARPSTTPSRRCARRSTSAAITRSKDEGCSVRHRAAWPDRRGKQLCAAAARRLRRISPVEFPAGDLRRPGERRADGRQYRGRKTGRADAADRRRGSSHHARGRHSGVGAAVSARRWRDRRPIVAHPAVAGVVFTGSTEPPGNQHRAANRTARSCR